jgi:hypothetical protein
LLSPDSNTTLASRVMDVRMAGTNVRIDAPEGVLSVLDATLSYLPRFGSDVAIDVAISVVPKDDVWEIHGHAGSLKVLGAQSALPQVAGAVVTSAMQDVAGSRDCKTMRACVVEKDGRALAFVGDDWESAITVATHLHGRGWSFIGSDNALLDPRTLEVMPIQKALYINSSSVAQLPLEYRRAVEASPWYVTSEGISFYAVDPHFAGFKQTWAGATVLEGVIVVDGAINDQPAIESIDAAGMRSERFTRLGVDWSRVRTADLRLGGFVDTCDLVEHWFESIRA